MMDKITALIQKNGWTQLEAAKQRGVTQPRINKLLPATFALFSQCDGQHSRVPWLPGGY